MSQNDVDVRLHPANEEADEQKEEQLAMDNKILDTSWLGEGKLQVMSDLPMYGECLPLDLDIISSSTTLTEEKSIEDQMEINSWLKNFYPNNFRANDITFSEKLYFYDRVQHKTGLFRMSVNLTKDLKHFEISVKSKFKNKLEIPECSRLYVHSLTDMRYITLFEVRSEFEKKSKTSATLREVEWEKIPYYFRIKDLHIDEKNGKFEHEEEYKQKNMTRALTEGGFILLLRSLAGTEFEGLMKFYILFINGKLCVCNLIVYKSRFINYFGNQIKIKEFHKAVQCPSGNVQKSEIIMTTYGQIIFQNWSDTELHLMLDMRAKLHNSESPPMNPDNLVPLRERFYEIYELYDLYTNEYYKNLSNYKNYFNRNTEALDIIHFLLKELLLKKPHRVYEFAANYFCELL